MLGQKGNRTPDFNNANVAFFRGGLLLFVVVEATPELSARAYCIKATWSNITDEVRLYLAIEFRGDAAITPDFDV